METFEPGELVSKYTTEGNMLGGGESTLSTDDAHFIVSRGEDTYLKMLLVDNLMCAPDLRPTPTPPVARRARRHKRCLRRRRPPPSPPPP